MRLGVREFLSGWAFLRPSPAITAVLSTASAEDQPAPPCPHVTWQHTARAVSFPPLWGFLSHSRALLELDFWAVSQNDFYLTYLPVFVIALVIYLLCNKFSDMLTKSTNKHLSFIHILRVRNKLVGCFRSSGSGTLPRLRAGSCPGLFGPWRPG